MIIKSITKESLFSLLYHSTAYIMDALKQQVKEIQNENEAIVRKHAYISHCVLHDVERKFHQVSVGNMNALDSVLDKF